MLSLSPFLSVPGTLLSATPRLPLTLQLAIESRVTSDDLQLAVSATDDKIAAVQSSVDSALSDRFRRMQNVVHEQARDCGDCRDNSPHPPLPTPILLMPTPLVETEMLRSVPCILGSAEFIRLKRDYRRA